MDQVGYQGVDARTFIDVANGTTPPPEEGEERPGITTDSLPPTTTLGFGKLRRDGLVKGRRRP